MKKAWIFIFLLAGIWVGQIWGQATKQASEWQVPGAKAAPDLYFNDIFITLTSGEVFAGYLVGFEEDSLVAKVGPKLEKFSRSQISRVTIGTPGKKGSRVVFAMVAGAYAYNVALLTAEGQPPFYSQRNGFTSVALIDAIAASAAGGLVYWLSGKEGRTFRFDGSQAKQIAAWEKMRQFITGSLPPKKLHLTVQPGHVFASVFNQYREVIQKKVSYHDTRDSTLNWLRKAKLMYSLKPSLEIGTAVCFLGQPSVSGYEYESGAGTWTTGYIIQSLASTGFFALAAWKPFPSIGAGKVDFQVGLGVGAAKVDFRFEATRETTKFGYNPRYYSTRESLEKSHIFSKTYLSGLVSAEFHYFLDRALSLGVWVDYIYLPREKAPAFPEFNFPAQTINLANGAAGVVLGVHF